MKVGIIDYGGGNIQSVANAFKAIGAETIFVASPQETQDLTHLVLPGQGEFGDCASKLKQANMFDTIKSWIAEDKPFLGICVGYQLLFEGSDECPTTKGLGILKGNCSIFSSDDKKVPHMGWNATKPTDASHPIWQDLGEDPYFYFVHSYYPTCDDAESIASTTSYGETFHSSITKGNTIATQFHPEKSQHTGLKLLKNFINL